MFRTRLSLVLVMVVIFMNPLLNTAAAQGDGAARIRAYVGTYTTGESRGIYLFEIDGQTGRPTEPRLVAELTNPSFVAMHPSGRSLYAVSEVGEFNGQRNSGGVFSFAVDPQSGDLKELNSQTSQGGDPCHLVVDATGKFVLVANYSGGSVAAFPINDDGSLKAASAFVQHAGSSIHPRRQTAPHAHSVNLDPGNRFAMVADLGLDKILIYRFDAERGLLEPNDPPAVSTEPGGGPRHFAFHPNGQFAYMNNELTLTITPFAYDGEKGILQPLISRSTLPEGADRRGASTAETLVHPSGKFVYVSNRGNDSIALFRIQPDGNVRPAGHFSTQGQTPRNFSIDPSGRFLLAANQSSGTIVVFQIHPETGELTPTGDVVSVPSPVCVRFLTVD